MNGPRLVDSCPVIGFGGYFGEFGREIILFEAEVWA